MKIIRTDRELEMPLVDQVLMENGHEVVLLPDGVSEAVLCKAIVDCDLLLMCYTPITRHIIHSASKLKAIIKYGVGIDAIDIPAANAKGIIVVNIPAYAEETVAEGAFALLIALAKKMPALGNQMSNHDWAWPTSRWMGIDLAQKTIGIIGCGKIGRRMATICRHGFRMHVIGYDPYRDKEELVSDGIEKYEDLNTLLKVSDFVSLHAVLNEETYHLIGVEELNNMQPHAFIINSARGALINEKALLIALENKQIAGAGLDVFSKEPLNQQDHPLRKLYQMDHVILFPHLTFYTKEAMDRLEKEVLERCLEVIENRPVFIKSLDPRLQNQQHLNTTYISTDS